MSDEVIDKSTTNEIKKIQIAMEINNRVSRLALRDRGCYV